MYIDFKQLVTIEYRTTDVCPIHNKGLPRMQHFLQDLGAVEISSDEEVLPPCSSGLPKLEVDIIIQALKQFQLRFD